VLFYKDGKLCRKLKGIGDQPSLTRNFAEHVGRTKPRRSFRPMRHDVNWLRQRFQTLCTASRGRALMRMRATFR